MISLAINGMAESNPNLGLYSFLQFTPGAWAHQTTQKPLLKSNKLYHYETAVYSLSLF